ncbi:MAG: bifunctional nuclease family protein [Acidimicrobiia bacterium]
MNAVVAVDVLGVQVAGEGQTPLVLLRELAEPHRIVPVAVGGNEAVAIALGLQRVETPRPMTHDLFVDVLASTHTTVDRVTITEVREGTFIAEVALGGSQGPKLVDCRPSDAIALAVRLDVPVFVAEAVVDEAGVELELEPVDGPEAEDAEEIVDEFRSFLDRVDPEDFADS